MTKLFLSFWIQLIFWRLFARTQMEYKKVRYSSALFNGNSKSNRDIVVIQWVVIDNAGSCDAPQQAITYSMPKKKFNLAVCFGTQ